jgi:hypothetical protein
VPAPDNLTWHGSIIPILRSAVADRSLALPTSLAVTNARLITAPEPHSFWTAIKVIRLAA